MNDGISLTFSGLDKAGAEMLIELYSDIKSGEVGTVTMTDTVTSGIGATAPVGTASAPASQPTTAAAASGPKKDNRGVPFNPAYHSDSLTEKGEWRRKRGTGDKKAEIDAWEKTVIASNVPSTAPAQMPAASNGANGAMPAPIAGGPAPMAAPSPMPTLAVSPETYNALWGKLCAEHKIDLTHQDFITKTFGNHPVHVVDPASRALIYAHMVRWDSGDRSI